MRNSLNKSDHDLLIGLVVAMDTFTKRYDSDMSQIKEGYTSKMTDLDSRTKVLEKTMITVDENSKKVSDIDLRLKPIEKMVDQIDPINSYKDYQTVKQEFHDWKTSARALRVIGGVIGGAVMFLLTQIPNMLRFFGIIK